MADALVGIIHQGESDMDSNETLDTYMKKVRAYLDTEYPVICNCMTRDAETESWHEDDEVTIITDKGTAIASILYYGFVKCSSVQETAGDLAAFYRINDEGSEADYE